MWPYLTLRPQQAVHIYSHHVVIVIILVGLCRSKLNCPFLWGFFYFIFMDHYFFLNPQHITTSSLCISVLSFLGTPDGGAERLREEAGSCPAGAPVSVQIQPAPHPRNGLLPWLLHDPPGPHQVQMRRGIPRAESERRLRRNSHCTVKRLTLVSLCRRTLRA